MSSKYILNTPYNATSNQVEDPFTYVFLMAIVVTAFSLLHHLLPIQTFNRIFKDTRAISDNLKTFELVWQTVIWLGLGTIGIFIIAWVYYLQDILGNNANYGVNGRLPMVAPQDPYSLGTASLGMAYLISGCIAGWIRYRRGRSNAYSQRSGEAEILFGSIIPRALFFAMLLFPTVYVYSKNRVNFTWAKTGILADMTLASTILLSIAYLSTWYADVYESPDQGTKEEQEAALKRERDAAAAIRKEKKIPYAIARIPKLEDKIHISKFLFHWDISDSDEFPMRYAAAEIDLVKASNVWLIAYVMNFFAVSLMVYGDALKPVVITVVAVLIPWFITKSIGHNGYFIPLHVTFLTYFIDISYLLQFVRPPPRVSALNPTAEFQNATNFGLMQTSQNYEELDGMRSTINFVVGVCLALSVFAVIWGVASANHARTGN